jgi:hypothetical protein
MTIEEEVARKYALILSVGRHIYQTHRLPKRGESWKVDALVIDCQNEFSRGPEIREFSFEIVITSELLNQANALARDFAVSRQDREGTGESV